MQALAICNQYAGRAIALLAALCALFVFLYGTLLLLAVSHAAQANAAEREVRALSQKVSVLEGQRLALQKTLTLQRGMEFGLVSPRATTVVYAPSQGLSFGR